jgi:small-conductance mechanosensitive channel
MSAAILLAMMMAVGAPALADQPPAPPAPAPEVIPLADVVGRAEETASRLREIRRKTGKDPELDEIEQRLKGLENRLSTRADETNALLAADPLFNSLGRLLGPWLALRNELAADAKLLVDRAAAYEHDLGDLDGLRQLWERTRDAARGSDTPPEVVQRMTAMVTDLEEARRVVESKRATVLLLQQRVGKDRESVDRAIERIGERRRDAMTELLARDTAGPLRPVLEPGSLGEARSRLRQAVVTHVHVLRGYLADHPVRLLGLVALFVGLGWLLSRARETTATVAREHPRARRVAEVLALPYSCALVLTLVLTGAFLPAESRVLTEVAAIAALVPALRITGRLLPRRLLPLVYSLGGFFIVDQVRDFLSSVPAVEEMLFFAEMVVLLLLLLLLERRLRLQQTDRRHRVRLTLVYVILTIVACAIGASLFGYTRLARLIGSVMLPSAYVAVLLLVTARVFAGIVACLLAVRPLRLLAVVQNHGWAIVEWAGRLLGLLAIITWVAFVLSNVELLGPTTQALRTLLAARFVQGTVSLSLGGVLIFAFVLWVSFQLSRAVRFVLKEDVFPRVALPRGVPTALSSFVNYLLLMAGFFFALAVVGIDLSRLALVVGALGVGIGLGLQGIVHNFVSGIVLLIERPIRVGDEVQVGTTGGTVSRIGIRSSTIRTGEGAEVIVPNASLISDSVTNWTLSDSSRRIEIVVGVAYGTDPKKVLGLLRQVALAHPRVSPDHPPLVLFRGFGQNTLDFQLLVWATQETWGVVRSDLSLAIDEALREAGIEVPLPRRDISIRAWPAPPGA